MRNSTKWATDTLHIISSTGKLVHQCNNRRFGFIFFANSGISAEDLKRKVRTFCERSVFFPIRLLRLCVSLHVSYECFAVEPGHCGQRARALSLCWPPEDNPLAECSRLPVHALLPKPCLLQDECPACSAGIDVPYFSELGDIRAQSGLLMCPY